MAKLQTLHDTAARCIVIAVTMAMAGGCATNTKQSQSTTMLEAPATSDELKREARIVPVCDGFRVDNPVTTPLDAAHRNGGPVSWERLVADCASADAVLIGENHGHPLGLAAASVLWDDILARSPNASLAMEFFERDEQLALSDFLSGVTDEAAFVKASGRSEGNYAPGHRAMILAAKNASRPVIAANAPRRYVRLARTEGYERLNALSPMQRDLFALPLSSSQPPYRENFDKVMNGSSAATDAMFRSQQLWDWTMAQSVGVAMDSGKPVVLVVGRFHIDNNGGTLQALRQMRPNARIVTVSFVDSEAAPGASLAADDVGRADYVIYVGAAPPTPAR